MSWNADLAIRAAERDDAGHMAALLTELGYPATREEVTRRLEYWLPDPMSLILVAEHSARLVGCLSLHAIPYLERTGRWARIESLVVDREFRGRGTGRSLIVAAENAARRWDCLTVEVTSLRTRTDAHSFYERMGYADVCGSSGRFLKTLADSTVGSSTSRRGLRD